MIELSVTPNPPAVLVFAGLLGWPNDKKKTQRVQRELRNFNKFEFSCHHGRCQAPVFQAIVCPAIHTSFVVHTYPYEVSMKVEVEISIVFRLLDAVLRCSLPESITHYSLFLSA
jgi:hypothetical protein